MKSLFALFLTAVLAACAEDAKPPAGPAQKIFQLKYADANRVADLLRPLGISVTSEPQARVLAVSGSAETIAAVEEALKKLDVPSPASKNIEITGFLLLGSPQGSGNPDSPELAAVIKQLRALSPYKSYRMLESFNLRDRDGKEGRIDGFLPPTWDEKWKPSYFFAFRRVSVGPSEGARLIRLDGVSLTIVISNGVRANLSTDIDIREGEKVVVGKANVNGSQDALFLVLSAKVVE